MNSQDNNLPEFTIDDYLRDMSEYVMLQAYKTGTMPTIHFREVDDINPTTVPEVNNNTITIKIPQGKNPREAYSEIINHCYEGVQLLIGNNNVTTVKIDPQPYSDKDIKTECDRSNFETDKENYHKPIKGPDGNNFKLTVYGYSPEKNTQTVPVNGTPDADKNEQEKVPNIDLLTGAFLQYMYSGFQDFPEYVDGIDDDNIDEMYLHTLLNIIRIKNTLFAQQPQDTNFTPPINKKNIINLYKAYLEGGENPAQTLINISKLFMIAQTININQPTLDDPTRLAASTLTDYHQCTKNDYQKILHDINPDAIDTEEQLKKAYYDSWELLEFINIRELTNENMGGINPIALGGASYQYKFGQSPYNITSGLNPALISSNTPFGAPQSPFAQTNDTNQSHAADNNVSNQSNAAQTSIANSNYGYDYNNPNTVNTPNASNTYTNTNNFGSITPPTTNQQHFVNSILTYKNPQNTNITSDSPQINANEVPNPMTTDDTTSVIAKHETDNATQTTEDVRNDSQLLSKILNDLNGPYNASQQYINSSRAKNSVVTSTVFTDNKVNL